MGSHRTDPTTAPADRTDGPPGSLPPINFSRFVWLWNRSQGRRTPRLHREICQWLDECWRANDRQLLLLVFRDSGKSTLAALYCAWLLHGDPDLRILVLSAEHALATKMTRNVRGILARHEQTRGLLDPRPECWAADRLTVRRTRVSRDPSLLARGIGGNFTGCRADVIVCDDVEVPNTADTRDKRLLLRERLRELSFVLVPGGLQLFIGTPHGEESIYAETARRDLSEPEPFLARFKRLTVPLVRTSGDQRWAERFPDPVIDRLMDGGGPAKFRSQLQLLPTRPEDVRLDPDQLIPYDSPATLVSVQGRDVLRIAGHRMVSAAAAWDPAYGRPDRGDSSVVAAVFVDADGRYWLHAIEYLVQDPRSAGETDEATFLCRAVAAFVARHHLPSISVETNGIGGFLPALLRQELRRAGVGALVIQRASTTPKDRRILEAFDPLLAARRLHVHRSVLASPFLDEMRTWRPGRRCRDDGLDAVASCLLAEPVRLPLVGGRLGGPSWRHGPASFEAPSDFTP